MSALFDTAACCTASGGAVTPEQSIANIANFGAAEKITQHRTYPGAWNPFGLVLLERRDTTPFDGQTVVGDWHPYPLANITRVIAVVASLTVDSDIDPTLVKWTNQDAAGNDKLQIYFGRAATQPLVGYLTLWLFDPSAPDGVVWIDSDPTSPPSVYVQVVNP